MNDQPATKDDIVQLAKSVNRAHSRIDDCVKDLSDMRGDYRRRILRRGDLDPDPFVEFRDWFQTAMEAPEVVEPNAMVLSTADSDGQPRARTMLLKAYDKRGFVFFTNYESEKAAEIAGNPKVALLFLWLPLERQLRIEGTAEKISHIESLKYFMSRPRDNRLGAWVSRQSSVISSRSLLLAKLDEVKRKFADGDVPLPSFWGGYRVVPSRFEFWQGGGARLHDRFRYSPEEAGDGWGIERLAP